MAYSNPVDKISFNLNFNVGLKSKNIPSDVIKVQKLLNLHEKNFLNKIKLSEDGICGIMTIGQILLFQKHVSGFKSPDSVVSPDGRTYLDLTKKINLPQKSKHKSVENQLKNKHKIDIEKFFNLISKEFTYIKNTNAIRFVTQKALTDPRIINTKWIPYILATILRECGAGFEPIREWGRGDTKDYGKNVIFIDPATNISYSHAYYGRGYCQLTWLENYINIGKELNLGYELAKNPDLALERETAYNILIHGMINGTFTRRKISTYINTHTCDYLNARRVINGLDHAYEISENAYKFLNLLTSSIKE